MKKLHLRIDLSLFNAYQLSLIHDFFSRFFKDVSFLDINQQKKIIEQFAQESEHKVISLDKFIPLEHNLDISRVFNIHGVYQYHTIKFNGRIAKNEHVIIYDHDAVGGFQLKLLKALLESQGCTIETKLLISLNAEQAEVEEILDYEDFISSGLVVDFSGVLRRVPYHVNPEILATRASIPTERYDEFKSGFAALLKVVHNAR